jgi:hypothetical protein
MEGKPGKAGVEKGKMTKKATCTGILHG